MNYKPLPYHRALATRITAQDTEPQPEMRDGAWNEGKGRSFAKRLEELPVNYYGAVLDSPEKKRARLGELSAPHTIFMGATGSGKTLGMKLHMKSILPPVHPDYGMNFRSLVYDAKSDMLPFMGQLGFSATDHIILTNPFDTRSVAWDLCDDIDNPADSQAFAEIVVQEGTGDAFWQIAAREMISAVIDGLNTPINSGEERRHWTLRHLIQVVDDPDLLRQVLERTVKGRGVKRDYIDARDDRLRSSLNATLRSHVTPYRLIAALWDHATFAFSMRRWAAGGGMLLIGDHYKYKEAMTRVNNALVRFAIDVLMDRVGEVKYDLTFLYLDELKNAGKFPNFGTMLTQGRSKGIRSVLAAQGLSTLKATFAKNEEQEVLNNTGNKAIMQLGSDEDAKWAERLFSTVERVKVSRTVPNDHRDKGSRTYTEVRESRIPASEFLNLPSASDNNGAITAFYHGPGAQASFSNVPPEELSIVLPRTEFDPMLPLAFDPRHKIQYELRPLRTNDYEQLGLVPDANTPLRQGARRFHPPPSQ